MTAMLIVSFISLLIYGFFIFVVDNSVDEKVIERICGIVIQGLMEDLLEDCEECENKENCLFYNDEFSCKMTDYVSEIISAKEVNDTFIEMYNKKECNKGGNKG
jgi:hypothetical protein